MFRLKTLYITNQLLHIAKEIIKHIYKLRITLFTTMTLSENIFILRDLLYGYNNLHSFTRNSSNTTNIFTNV